MRGISTRWCWTTFTFIAVSLRNMAASSGAAGGAGSDLQSPGPDSPPLQYSLIMEHLIGDKRPIKELSPGVIGGLPVPPKSDEQKMIERAMESCSFKAALACVGGEILHI
ncbi:mitochondrial import inner membrane translocase subunit Tim22-like [Plectropomus leopardus]|uniref:mitochondrial import inner membrane translocase subunit Tim22-like n=1 Tax=Plectropomus leopardus TaxID=160734 RepID=UPI001C4CA9D4|nr:mitochondrial import inner membrane translocase subunit Tim22-like [Plectropomus leopardus]